MEIFVKAMSNICCPYTQLLEYINNVQECMKTNCSSIVSSSFENIFKDCFITEENQKFKGKEFKALDIYKDKLKIVLGIKVLYKIISIILLSILFKKTRK